MRTWYHLNNSRETPALPVYYRHILGALADSTLYMAVQVTCTNVLPRLFEKIQNLKVDIYYPPNYRFETKLPLVILVHGFQEVSTFDKDMVQHIDWAKLIAAYGMIAVSAQAGMSPLPNSYHVLEFLAANADVLGLDMARIGFWACSSQGRPVFKALEDQELPYRESFRAAVFFYLGLAPVEPGNWPQKLSLFIVKAGGDQDMTNKLMDSFVTQVRSRNMSAEYIELDGAPHGFDVELHTPEGRNVIQKALEFFRSQLLQ